MMETFLNTALSRCIPKITGFKLIRQFSLPAETIRYIWIPPRLRDLLLPSMTTVHKNDFSTGSRIMRTVSAGSYLSRTGVPAGSTRSRAEAKTDSLERNVSWQTSLQPECLALWLPFSRVLRVSGHRWLMSDEFLQISPT